MKIIGAGFPRTGTMSMQAALDQLGFPCYHMETVVRNPSHLKVWDDFYSGHAPMDWSFVFRDYEATVDAPACYFYKQLMEEYPDAKVILTVRDPERWYLSAMKLYSFVGSLRVIGLFVPPLGRFLKLARQTFVKAGGTEGTEKALWVETFERHNAEVQEYVPAERLLVFEVKDGWEPLCEFLGTEVPDSPFPHLNSGDQTVREKFNEIFFSGPLTKVVRLFRRSS